MYLTFDEQTSSTGIKTRIEAFYDMLKMKKEALAEEQINIKEITKQEKLESSDSIKTKLQTQN